MRLHEAAPKLIIQERLGDKGKVSSYWPVPELTRAELALGRLQRWCRKPLKGYCGGLISGYIDCGVCPSKTAVGPGGQSTGDKD